MSSDVRKIRGFLLQQPKPAKVRLTNDGVSEDIAVGRSFVKLAETICAKGGDLIEALNASGDLIRAMRMDEEEIRRSDAAEIPKGIEADPQALMLTHFANLLHRAYEHSTEIAFVKFVELVDKMNDRSESIEQRLERAEAQNRRLMQEAADEAIERAEERAQAEGAAGTGGFAESILQSYMQGAVARSGAPKPPVNGKGHA